MLQVEVLIGSVMAVGPGVKRCVLQPRSLGRFYIKRSCPFADISGETDVSYMEEADEWLYMVLSVRPVLC